MTTLEGHFARIGYSLRWFPKYGHVRHNGTGIWPSGSMVAEKHLEQVLSKIPTGSFLPIVVNWSMRRILPSRPGKPLSQAKDQR